MSKLLKVKVNGKFADIKPGNLVRSLKQIGLDLPTVCYHPDIINSGGRCRVCVCRVDGKLVTPCNIDATEGMDIDTASTDLQHLRQTAQALIPTMPQSLVATHPTATDKESAKRTQKVVGKIVPTDKDTPGAVYPRSRYIIRKPELCVHCNLCVQMCAQLQGVGAVADLRKDVERTIGTADSQATTPTGTTDPQATTPTGTTADSSAAIGEDSSEIGSFHGCELPETECISCGQCINVCPTGALEEASEIDEVEASLSDASKVTVVQFAPAVRVALAEEFGCAPGTRSLTHEMVEASKLLGDRVFVFDTNFTADLCIMEEGYELLERLRRTMTGSPKFGNPEMQTALPMITSCSPGWVLFCEKNYHDLLPHLSSCKSPMQMSGALTKHFWAKKLGYDPKDVASVAVMPCVAKKAEKTRPEFRSHGVCDVDNVLTTREFAKLLKKREIDPTKLHGVEFDKPYGISTGAGLIFGATGGVMEAALRTAYEVVTGHEVPFWRLNISPVRGMEGVREASVKIEHALPSWKFLEGAELKVAVAHGTSNARKLMDRIREAKERGLPPPYHFVEVMACPGGCLGGGGQPKPTSMEIKTLRAGLIYSEDEGLPIRKSHENPAVKSLYETFLKEPLGHESHHLLHTKYEAREPEATSYIGTEEAKELRQEVLYHYPKARSRITNLLSDVVDKYGYVSDTAIVNIANHVGTTPVNMDAIVSHYHFFPRQPVPKTMIYLCECLHCRLHGALEVRKTLKERGIPFHSASWLGWCVNGAPSALVKHIDDPQVHRLHGLKPDDSRLNTEYLNSLKDPLLSIDTDAVNVLSSRRFDATAPSVVDNLVIDPALKAAAPVGTCPATHHMFSMDPEIVLAHLKRSGLRGCGGAGFSAHFKWSSVRKQPGPKYVVINADEGLPSTFKDFYLLQHRFSRMRMLVGACLGAQTVGAKHILLYLRYEYKNLKPILEQSFQAYRKLNPLLAHDIQFEVVLGGGPYVCGEETALFESVEGHAPQARSTRTIYPTVHGLFGMPTLVGNVETFTWIPAVVMAGGARFSSFGATQQQDGLKLLCISGDVAKPTVGEFRMGATLQSVLEEVCDIPLSEIAAVEVGGMMEPLILPSQFKKPISLDGKGLAGGGSIVVFSKKNFNESAIYQAKAKFAHVESCQLCAPCRDGTRILRKSMRGLLSGQLHESQRVHLHKLTEAMEMSSNCGHGKACGHMARVLMDHVYGVDL